MFFSLAAGHWPLAADKLRAGKIFKPKGREDP